jgi:hypothetical protein
MRKMEDSLAISWVGIMAAQFIYALFTPAIIFVVAIKLWNCVPKWISLSFGASAVSSILQSIPTILMQLNLLPPQQYYTMIAIPLSMISGIAHILFAIALLALAIRVSKTQAGQPPVDNQPEYAIH